MTSSYTNWPLDKLKKEALKIEKAIKSQEAKAKKNVLAEIKALARKNGFDLNDLVAQTATKSTKANGKSVEKAKSARQLELTAAGENSQQGVNKRVKKTRAKAPIKYRNPSNERETWTGRGRQPRWVVMHLERGGSLEEILVS